MGIEGILCLPRNGILQTLLVLCTLAAMATCSSVARCLATLHGGALFTPNPSPCFPHPSNLPFPKPYDHHAWPESVRVMTVYIDSVYTVPFAVPFASGLVKLLVVIQ